MQKYVATYYKTTCFNTKLKNSLANKNLKKFNLINQVASYLATGYINRVQTETKTCDV